MSEGALVVDIPKREIKKELPPCLIVKSNGASLYATTDLATIVEREKLFSQTRLFIWRIRDIATYLRGLSYVAKKAKIVRPEVRLNSLALRMNGKDGKPFRREMAAYFVCSHCASRLMPKI